VEFLRHAIFKGMDGSEKAPVEISWKINLLAASV